MTSRTDRIRAAAVAVAACLALLGALADEARDAPDLDPADDGE